MPNPQNLIPAKKGEVRNPLGAGSHNPMVKRIRALTLNELAEIGTLLLDKTEDELKAIATDPAEKMTRKWMASVAYDSFKRKKHEFLFSYLDRLVGKIPQQINSINVHIVEQMKSYENMDRKQLVEQLRAEADRIEQLESL